MKHTATKNYFVLMCLLLGISYCSQSMATDFSISFDRNQSSSAYGLPVETEMSVNTFQLSASTDKWQFDVAVPHTRIKGPAVFFSFVPYRWFVQLSEERRRQILQALNVTSPDDILNAETKGLSDVSLSAGHWFTDEFVDAYQLGLFVDVKLPTGDEKKILGTGTRDVTTRVEWQSLVGESWMPQLSMGYVNIGDSDRFVFEDYFFSEFGTRYFVNDDIDIGMSYYLGLLDKSEDIRAFTLEAGYSFNDKVALSIVRMKGLTESSEQVSWQFGISAYF